jgi:hypothetical protein
VAGEGKEGRVWKPGERFGRRTARGLLMLDEPSANYLNELVAELKRRASISGTLPVTIDEGSDGRSISIGLRRRIFARLSDSGPGGRYSFKEQEWDGSHFVDGGGHESGDNAWESNALEGLDGQVVFLIWEDTSADWRFQWNGLGCSANSVCVTFKICDVQTPGQDVELWSDDETTLIASCTTALAVYSVRIRYPGLHGSGYDPLSPPSVTITAAPGHGSGATATVDVSDVDGSITGIHLTSGGSGYDVDPTVTIDAPPTGGTQAYADALAGAVCCFGDDISKGYYRVKATVTGNLDMNYRVRVECGDNVFATGTIPDTHHICFATTDCGVFPPCTTAFAGGGATVEVQHPAGTIIASGTADAAGSICFDVAAIPEGSGEGKDCYVVRTEKLPRFKSSTRTVCVSHNTCVDPPVQTVGLATDDDYICLPKACNYPVKKTLQFDDGSGTLEAVTFGPAPPGVVPWMPIAWSGWWTSRTYPNPTDPYHPCTIYFGLIYVPQTGSNCNVLFVSIGPLLYFPPYGGGAQFGMVGSLASWTCPEPTFTASGGTPPDLIISDCGGMGTTSFSGSWSE